MARVTPNFIEYIKKFGAFDISACYNCGNCTAICPLSEEGSEFPRKQIRYAILGLEDKILSLTEPWLCYYCGECSETCPRKADPGGFMMALRRYLTTKYDWTGFSKYIYLSEKVKVVAVAALALFTALIVWLFHGPIILDRVALATFAPVHIVELGDIVILVVLATLLIGNIYRMYRFTVKPEELKDVRIPLSIYIKEFIKTVPIHFLTQMRFLGCGNGRRNWLLHLFIVYGYAASFISVVIFIRFVQTDQPYFLQNIPSIVWTIATALLLYGTIAMIYGRIKKSQPLWEYSHSTDWMFLILLLITAVTGVLVSVFRTFGFPLATYITYTIHLAVTTPFLVLEVPFAKWSHLAYRPFAIYFSNLRKIAESLRQSEKVQVPATAVAAAR